jgi:DNA-binding transcriptional regulator YhcF (GntR family)
MADLTLTLDYHSKTPLYQQLCAYVIGEMRAGRLKAGRTASSARCASTCALADPRSKPYES